VTATTDTHRGEATDGRRPDNRRAWWEELPGNLLGQAHAITTVSQIRPGKAWRVRAYFKLGRTFPVLGKKLRALSFIHAARWTIVEQVPGTDRPLASPVLLFESNFNGEWSQYIDAFAYVIPERMAGVWATSWGWPGARPAGPFKAYIRDNEHEASHFYSAYPDHTVTEITAALSLQAAYEEFAAGAASLTPAEFDVAWRAFLTKVQPWL
jgi:hypothetical protein